MRIRATQSLTSAMGVECTHGMPTPASCWECMEEGNLESKPKDERRPYFFAAKYEGYCTGCHETIKVGQTIGQHPGFGYIHEECWTDG